MMNFDKLKPLIYSLSSALLLSLPWVCGFWFTIFFAFVPLLVMQNNGTKHLQWWSLLTFCVWICATCWWVAMATKLAIFIVPLVGLCFTFVPFAIYLKLSRKVSDPIKWILFITLWISFEALYTYNDISFPWLTLGNAFNAQAVQWYSVTGVFGGSLWVLFVNVLAFKSVQYYSLKKTWKNIYIYLFLGFLVIPYTISLINYYTYHEEVNPIQVAVIQPNINPYTEKFKKLSNQQQIAILLDLSSGAPLNTDFFVAPETAIDDNIWLDRLRFNNSLDTLSRFLSSHYPSSTFVSGATTFGYLAPGQPFDYNTYSKGELRFHIYNSALWIDSSKNVNVYHKSKLVCGVEMIPYPFIFQAIDDILKVDLGGFGGKNGRSQDRQVYKNSGTAICYEAIYGEFFTEYIQKGAQFMFIISNDGWWGNTLGHRHLLRYSTLRSVETRRSIARSANTGISAIINQRGDVVESLGWDKRGLIVGQINANNYQTFYVKNGDFIVRLVVYILVLTLVYLVAIRFYKKNNSM